MAQVKQLDKRSGITYVYESKAHWDKEKRQSRAVFALSLDASTPRLARWSRRTGAESGAGTCSRRRPRGMRQFRR